MFRPVISKSLAIICRYAAARRRERPRPETPQGYSATVEQAQRQKQLGADVIALSCTGMSSIQIAPALERETGLPVLDPVMCEGLMTLFELIRKDARTQ